MKVIVIQAVGVLIFLAGSIWLGTMLDVLAIAGWRRTPVA
jgi:hypothetical protein